MSHLVFYNKQIKDNKLLRLNKLPVQLDTQLPLTASLAVVTAIHKSKDKSLQ